MEIIFQVKDVILTVEFMGVSQKALSFFCQAAIEKSVFVEKL